MCEIASARSCYTNLCLKRKLIKLKPPETYLCVLFLLVTLGVHER